jgi:hypothetical protein
VGKNYRRKARKSIHKLEIVRGQELLVWDCGLASHQHPTGRGLPPTSIKGLLLYPATQKGC